MLNLQEEGIRYSIMENLLEMLKNDLDNESNCEHCVFILEQLTAEEAVQEIEEVC